MSSVTSLRRAISLTPVLLVVALGVTAWWGVSAEPTNTSQAKITVAPTAEDVTVEPEATCNETGALLAAKKPCKPCKDRPWCECTYQGAPRISCDPCCYDTFPWPTCMD